MIFDFRYCCTPSRCWQILSCFMVGCGVTVHAVALKMRLCRVCGTISYANSSQNPCFTSVRVSCLHVPSNISLRL